MSQFDFTSFFILFLFVCHLLFELVGRPLAAHTPYSKYSQFHSYSVSSIFDHIARLLNHEFEGWNVVFLRSNWFLILAIIFLFTGVCLFWWLNVFNKGPTRSNFNVALILAVSPMAASAVSISASAALLGSNDDATASEVVDCQVGVEFFDDSCSLLDGSADDLLMASRIKNLECINKIEMWEWEWMYRLISEGNMYPMSITCAEDLKAHCFEPSAVKAYLEGSGGRASLESSAGKNCVDVKSDFVFNASYDPTFMEYITNKYHDFRYAWKCAHNVAYHGRTEHLGKNGFNFEATEPDWSWDYKRLYSVNRSFSEANLKKMVGLKSTWDIYGSIISAGGESGTNSVDLANLRKFWYKVDFKSDHNMGFGDNRVLIEWYRHMSAVSPAINNKAGIINVNNIELKSATKDYVRVPFDNELHLNLFNNKGFFLSEFVRSPWALDLTTAAENMAKKGNALLLEVPHYDLVEYASQAHNEAHEVFRSYNNRARIKFLPNIAADWVYTKSYLHFLVVERDLTPDLGSSYTLYERHLNKPLDELPKSVVEWGLKQYNSLVRVQTIGSVERLVMSCDVFLCVAEDYSELFNSLGRLDCASLRPTINLDQKAASVAEEILVGIVNNDSKATEMFLKDKILMENKELVADIYLKGKSLMSEKLLVYCDNLSASGQKMFNKSAAVKDLKLEELERFINELNNRLLSLNKTPAVETAAKANKVGKILLYTAGGVIVAAVACGIVAALLAEPGAVTRAIRDIGTFISYVPDWLFKGPRSDGSYTDPSFTGSIGSSVEPSLAPSTDGSIDPAIYDESVDGSIDPALEDESVDGSVYPLVDPLDTTTIESIIDLTHPPIDWPHRPVINEPARFPLSEAGFQRLLDDTLDPAARVVIEVIADEEKKEL